MIPKWCMSINASILLGRRALPVENTARDDGHKTVPTNSTNSPARAQPGQIRCFAHHMGELCQSHTQTREPKCQRPTQSARAGTKQMTRGVCACWRSLINCCFRIWLCECVTMPLPSTLYAHNVYGVRAASTYTAAL